MTSSPSPDRRPVPAPTVEERFALTPTQEGMLVGSLRGGSGDELHQIVVGMEPNVNVRRLRDAWERSVQRHAMLRTSMRWADEPFPVQEVWTRVALPFVIRKASELEEFLADDRRMGLDLTKAPAFRLTLVETGEGLSTLVFTHHHAMLDGRAQRLLLEEVLRDYDAGSDAGTASIDERAQTLPAPRFREHFDALQRRDREADRLHFESLLHGAEICALPRTAAAEAAVGRGEVSARLSLRDPQRPFAERSCSNASLLQAAWALILSVHTRADDVMFGVTRNARHLTPRDRDIVACLVNTVPVRVGIDGASTVGALGDSVQAQSLAVRPHEHASLTDIQGWLKVDRLPFDTLMVYERFTLDADLKGLGGAFARRSYHVRQRSSFPLVLAAYQDGLHVDLYLEFDESQWTTETMQVLLERLVHVFDQMQADPDRRLDAVDVMLANEPERLVAWGRGPLAQSGVASALVGPTIGARATSQPTAPSYVDARGREWSYADLMQRRDATARRLAALLGPAPAVVAVASRRTIDYVALQLAAYSHGWMLVPLDPEWPAHRMRAVMDVAAPALVLYDDPDVGRRLRQIVDERRALEPDPRTQAAAAAPGSVVALAATAVAPLVEDGESVRTAVIVPPPVSAAEASWPVYSIFTSGSTGAPKGVLIAQRALAAHGHGAVHAYGLGAADRVLQFAAPAFDVAVEETIPTLMAGGALIELPEGLMADLRAFLAFVHQRRLTVLNLPSAFFHLLMLHLDEQRATLPACVRLVVIGSEKPTSWSVSTFVERHPGVRLMNAYGPTEATITSLVCDVSGLALAGGLQGDPPIGRPLGACEVMLLDQRSSPCPVGIAGEICIAGPQVAMGYINAPEQAASRLTRSPRDGAPMYRTGDLGRWRADGLIEFLGRADEQVKIRGVRVEPGEIEAAIRAIDGVNDAAVVVRSAGRGNELVAFVVKRVDFMATEAALRAHLQERLPGAFVPSEIRYIAELPLNTSGKVHRKALAEEARRLVPSSREITGPTGDLETYIHGVFTRLLERGDIDIDDSFFDIGGHSLLAVRLVGELNGIAKTPVALATVFGSPSVRALASSIGTLRTAVQLPSVIALNARATTYLRADEAARALEPEPMFFICGVHLYTRVAQAMEPDRAAFGIFLDFDAEVVAGKRLRLHVPTMAAEYLAKLRDVCPRGPYLLAGVSFGGMLAYEMAQQLRAAGDDVRLLVLLDTILPRAFVARGRREVMMRWVRRYFVRSLGMDPKVALREALGRWFGRAPHRAASEEGLKVLRDRVFRAAAEEHDTRVAPYDGAVVLIRARQRLDLDDERITWDLGWSGLLPHGTAFFAVDGDHLGILVEPGNLEVARIVRQQVALLDDQRRRMPVPPRFK